MFLFDFLDKVSKILASFSSELIILLQINQPLRKPGNITMKSDTAHIVYVLAKAEMHTQSVQAELHQHP
jgi:hypothetical protein